MKKKPQLGIVTKVIGKVIPPHPTVNLQLRDLSDPREKKVKKKFRKKVVKRNKKKLAANEELFTIVRGLHSFVKQEYRKEFMPIFEEHVLEISSISIEASLMIYKHYTDILRSNNGADSIEFTDELKLRPFFSSLTATAKGEKCDNTRNENEAYYQMRANHGINYFYNGTHKTNSIAFAADALLVNLANNVREHMYVRVRAFFKAIEPDIPSYETLNFLFNEDSEFQPNQILIDGLRNELAFSGNFFNLTSEWYTFIPFLYRLQQWRCQRNLKTFHIFPILRHKRHHIQIDGQALQQFLRTWKLCDSRYNIFAVDEQSHWRRYFHIDKLENNNHKFFGSIRTDGVKVSITMKRTKTPMISEEDRLNQIRRQLENQTIKTITAFDPGMRLTFAGVSVNNGVETNIKFSSASHRFDSGEHTLTQIYHKFTNQHMNMLRSERNKLPHQASAAFDPDTGNSELIEFKKNYKTQFRSVYL